MTNCKHIWHELHGQQREQQMQLLREFERSAPLGYDVELHRVFECCLCDSVSYRHPHAPAKSNDVVDVDGLRFD